MATALNKCVASSNDDVSMDEIYDILTKSCNDKLFEIFYDEITAISLQN